MGMHYVNKMILLDEKDLEADHNSEFVEFDDLVDALEDHSRRFGDEGECPRMNLVGCSSERFDTTTLCWQDYCQSMWLEEDATWRKGLGTLFEDLGSISQEQSQAFFRSGDLAALTEGLRDRLVTRVRESRFSEARRLLEAMETSAESGLPCFRSDLDFTSGGEAGAYDMRPTNHEPGKRVLLEIAYLWG